MLAGTAQRRANVYIRPIVLALTVTITIGALAENKSCVVSAFSPLAWNRAA